MGEHTNRGEFIPDVQDHNDIHDQGYDVHEGRSALEDNGVGQLNVPGIAVGLDAMGAHNGRHGAYNRT